MDETTLGRAIALASDDAIVGTDLHGRITSWNPAAERLFGRVAADAVGQPIELILPGGQRAGDRAPAERTPHTDILRNVEAIRRHPDGAELRVSVTVAPLLMADGEIVGAVRVLRDLSDRARAERASRRLAAIVESSEDAIVGKDLSGIVTSWNEAAERMFGYTAAEIVGQSIRTLIPHDRQAEEDEVLARVCRGQRVEHFETVRRRKDGRPISVSITVSPIRDGEGTVVGASKIARDISDRQQAEVERERLLRVAQEHAATTDILNRVGAVVASTLDRAAAVQAVTDAATELTTAAFGVFEPTFQGTGAVRSDDITQDPRYGRHAPRYGMPHGHLPVRSYLAVPVMARSGDVLGGLFFSHPETGRFTEQHERLAAGIARWASVALENARLYVGLQEANRLKDEFLATLSHELRTPLNAILGYARMLRSGVIAPQHVGRAVETIERNATSLTQIVEDVLDVSRFISGKLRLDVQPVDLPDTVRHAVDAVVPAADAKNIRLELVIDPRAGPISGDAERLQQVVWNLLSNAVKFTPKDGKVQVRVERVNSHVEVIVCDTGIGIAPAFLPHVFEHFRQEDASPSRERGGLGLGLGIARQLVEMHGGTIHAASGGPGQGSTFRVTLPLIVAHPELHAVETRVHPAGPAAHDYAAPPDLRGVRVLAVDDDDDARRMVRDILEASGAQVFTAPSGEEALACVANLRPDVLLADIGMPHMDGFALITRIRQHPDACVRALPAAALTAYARSQDRARALRCGFNLHLAKPVDPSELAAAISTLARHTTPD
jgi:PAS domain S-box-containing protein